jgi:hypothetical protein
MLARDEFLTNLLQLDLTLQGHRLKMPLLYRDASTVTAIFPARAGAVRRLLPRKELRPVPLAPGIASVAITFFEYRDTDIGAYNELAVSIPALWGSRPIPGWTVAQQLRRGVIHAWVHRLPVTTEIARVGGVEVYGYPKFLAGIDYAAKRHRFDGALHHDGRRVLGLSGEVPRKERTDVPMRIVTYSQRNGRMLEAQVLMKAATLATGGGKRLHLDLDDEHPIATELRPLLLSRHPLYVQHAESFQSILHPPSCLE